MKKNEKLKIIPLGGLDRIGMNITLFEYKGDILVVDCGVAFPDDDMLGIDLVVPDVTYLKENLDKVRGIVLTHGHLDHIGALPYVLKDINVPVYGTRLTLGLVKNNLEEHHLLDKVNLNVKKHGQKVRFGKMVVEFIRTNHSIADASAFAIHTAAGVIVHSGDFKVDYSPIYGRPIDLSRFAELGKKGVLALLADSTNAVRKGATMSESSVGKTFDHIFDDNKGKRLIVATFASNVDRVQQIITAARNHKRKVVIEGRSMINVVTTARELGYIKAPKNLFVEMNDVHKYRPGQLVFIMTGSQGEPMAALSRMANKSHRKVAVKEGDVVVYSSTPIPGNEKYISNTINELYRQGAEVIVENTHVSGHARQEELKLLHTLVKPKYFIPVHGEYRHLKKHAELAKGLGMKEKDIFILENGNVFELDKSGGKVVDEVSHQPLLVDGLGVGEVGNVVLRDRQKLSQDGLIMVVVTLQKKTNKVLAGPEIVSRGFVYVRESEDLIKNIKRVSTKSLQKCRSKKMYEWSKMKTMMRNDLREYLWVHLKRNPLILPVIMVVD